MELPESQIKRTVNDVWFARSGNEMDLHAGIKVTGCVEGRNRAKTNQALEGAAVRGINPARSNTARRKADEKRFAAPMLYSLRSRSEPFLDVRRRNENVFAIKCR